MIRVPRVPEIPPDKLLGTSKGKTERDRVLDEFNKHVREGKDLMAFSFKYKAYKHDAVKDALTTLFRGKCAYCESRYAGTQPMDVEHWRPKGEVHLLNNDGSTLKLPGYYWLASEWTNLLPSCIDCNRSRTQYDKVLKQNINLGKANQFPVDGKHIVAGDIRVAAFHTLDPENVGEGETPLLLNPCVDDPNKFIEYDPDEAVVRPAMGAPPTDDVAARAHASIRVYALNRTELVHDRAAVLKRFSQRKYTIERLVELLDSADVERFSDRTVRIIEDLLEHEFGVLRNMMDPDHEYSGMCRQLIEKWATDTFGQLPSDLKDNDR